MAEGESYEPCCSDLKQAMADDFIKWDAEHATVFNDMAAGVIIPFTYCPWCGKKQPRTLATTPAMLYRP